MSLDLTTFFWPPTVLAGILILALTLIVARVYPYMRKRMKFDGKATIKFNDESFFIRGLATGIALSSLLVQASNVQPFTALSGAGIGQLYIALGLLIASGILVSNFKQRLDSYVVPIESGKKDSLITESDVAIKASVETPLDDNSWKVLNAAQASFANSWSTNKIARDLNMDSAEVFKICLMLKDKG
jgi:hypothetical protein